MAKVDSASGALLALSRGSCEVSVRDTRVANHTQISTLHVVTPVSLRFLLEPASPTAGKGDSAAAPGGDTWHVVAGREYTVSIHVLALHSGREQRVVLTRATKLAVHMDNPPTWTSTPLPDPPGDAPTWIPRSLLKTLTAGSGRLQAQLSHGKEVGEGMGGGAEWGTVRC